MFLIFLDNEKIPVLFLEHVSDMTFHDVTKVGNVISLERRADSFIKVNVISCLVRINTADRTDVGTTDTALTFLVPG